jgi:DNA-binding SARP family transcriptional activator
VGIEVRLLGGFSANVDREPVPDGAWRLRKARTLVKLLALASRRTLHRGQLIDYLWPSTSHTGPRTTWTKPCTPRVGRWARRRSGSTRSC